LDWAVAIIFTNPVITFALATCTLNTRMMYGPSTLDRMPFRKNRMLGDRLTHTALARSRVSIAVLHVVRAMTMVVSPTATFASDHLHVTGLRASLASV
jgi:hypothetical protein